MPWRTGEHVEVGIYWPYDGAYGGQTVVHNLEEAAAYVDKLKGWHYGEGNQLPGCTPSEIHVRRVRVERIALTDLPTVKGNSDALQDHQHE